MRKVATLAALAFALALGVLILLLVFRAPSEAEHEEAPRSATAAPRGSSPVAAIPAAATTNDPEPDRGSDAFLPTNSVSEFPLEILNEDNRGFLYGRVTARDGSTYEGRLRFGDHEEAFWGEYFNGVKADNPWAKELSADQLSPLRPVKVFGVELAKRRRAIRLERPFMARFGDLVLLESRGRELHVTLKNGTKVVLDAYESDDFADGIRIWDEAQGVIDLAERKIASLELFPVAEPGPAPDIRLYATVKSNQGDFSGFIQWNRELGVGSDLLSGNTVEGDEVSVPFDTIRSIAREATGGVRVTLLNGTQVALSGSKETGVEHRGVYVNDPRYGRVLVSWNAFQELVFSPAGSGPAYGDFTAGRPLRGTVATTNGKSLSGRLVFDLDESQSNETLDAPIGGIDYTIPFGFVTSIAKEQGTDTIRVVLSSEEVLLLEKSGDLSPDNGGMLVFTNQGEQPQFVPWTEVQAIQFEGVS